MTLKNNKNKLIYWLFWLNIRIISRLYSYDITYNYKIFFVKIFIKFKNDKKKLYIINII